MSDRSSRHAFAVVHELKCTSVLHAFAVVHEQRCTSVLLEILSRHRQFPATIGVLGHSPGLILHGRKVTTRTPRINDSKLEPEPELDVLRSAQLR